MSEFEKLHAALDVAAVRLAVGRQLAAGALQLAIPLLLEPLVLVGRDVPVQLVEVEALQTLLELRLFGLQGRHRLLVVLLLLGGAGLQGGAEGLEDPLVELKPGKQAAQALAQDLLADVGLGAALLLLVLVGGGAAVVVDVGLAARLALQLGRDLVAAVAAGQQPGEGELALLVSPPEAAVHDRLNLVEEGLRHDRRVLALPLLAGPAELPGVERVAQHLVDRRVGDHAAAGGAGGQALLPRVGDQVPDRVLAGGIQLEDPAHDRGPLRVQIDVPGDGVVEVAERGLVRVVALGGLLPRPLGRLLPQVVDVGLGEDDLDVVDQHLVPGGGLAHDHAFLEQVDLDVARRDEVVELHEVPEVPVQAVGLLDDHRHRLLAGLQVLQHGVELLAPGHLGRLGLHELVLDRQALGQRIGVGGLELSGDREPGLLLVLGADTGVDDGLADRGDGLNGLLFAAGLPHG